MPKEKKQSQKKSPVRKNKKQLEADCKEYLDGWQRAQADYKNLKVRMGEDLLTSRESGKTETLEQLLPVIDNFESALGSTPDHLQDDPWVKGIEFVRQQFETFLQETGVEEISTKGQFNPELHEAVEQEEDKKAKPGEILKTTRKGYRLEDTVLRPAGVVVAAE